MDNRQKSSSLDDLLSNIETEHKNKQKSSSQLPSMKQKDSDSLDNYLNEIQSNLNNKQQLSSQGNKQQKKSQFSHTDDLLNDIQAKFKQQPSQSQAKFQTKADKDDLDNIAQSFQAKRKQASEIKQQEKLQLIQQEELNKQRRRKQLTLKAKEWLKNLDPTSDEGFWFEEFAYSYESKLEAAIDYLEALESQ